LVLKDSFVKDNLGKDDKDQALIKQNLEYNTEYKAYFTDTLTRANGK
jgi:hypothetical protein